MAYTLVADSAQCEKYKQEESAHPNTRYHLEDRVVKVFWSDVWCVSVESPDYGKDGGARYGFTTFDDEESAHRMAEQWATDPLSSFDAVYPDGGL